MAEGSRSVQSACSGCIPEIIGASRGGYYQYVLPDPAETGAYLRGTA
ncbi:hypothetical protein [Paenibacillus sp. S150]|nr:hypothetical protein [Paenibacillus sp. S150]MBW4082909.1 hypothetical protein [Paenibacillus sp. S150]